MVQASGELDARLDRSAIIAAVDFPAADPPIQAEPVAPSGAL